MEQLCETCALDREGRFNKTCRQCQDASLVLRVYPHWTPNSQATSISNQQMRKIHLEISAEIERLDRAISSMNKQLAQVQKAPTPLLPIGARVTIEGEIVTVDEEQGYYYVAVSSKEDGEEIMREWFSAEDVKVSPENTSTGPFTIPVE